MRRASVLLADDHEAFLEVEVRLLESEFEVVETVRDGQAAVEAAARLAPDVLVLDISMPLLDGSRPYGRCGRRDRGRSSCS